MPGPCEGKFGFLISLLCDSTASVLRVGGAEPKEAKCLTWFRELCRPEMLECGFCVFIFYFLHFVI